MATEQHDPMGTPRWAYEMSKEFFLSIFLTLIRFWPSTGMVVVAAFTNDVVWFVFAWAMLLVGAAAERPLGDVEVEE